MMYRQVKSSHARFCNLPISFHVLAADHIPDADSLHSPDGGSADSNPAGTDKIQGSPLSRESGEDTLSSCGANEVLKLNYLRYISLPFSQFEGVECPDAKHNGRFPLI